MKTKFELGEKVWFIEDVVEPKTCNMCGSTACIPKPGIVGAIVVAMCLIQGGEIEYAVQELEIAEAADLAYYCGDEPFKYTDDNLFKTKRAAQNALNKSKTSKKKK